MAQVVHKSSSTSAPVNNAGPSMFTSRCSMLGVKKTGGAPQVGKWTRRLPTIQEGDHEDNDVAATSEIQPPVVFLSTSGLGKSFASLAELASDSNKADVMIKILQDGGNVERNRIVTWLSKFLPTLALSESGSKVAQVALESATGPARKLVVSEFHGYACRLCTSAHGYQVLVTVIETMPASEIGFVARELKGHSIDLARNRFGSRVLEAMSMHCTENQLTELELELMTETVQLSRHPHGSSVLQHLLEYGSNYCKATIVQNLLRDMPSLSMDRVAGLVVEKALSYSGPNEMLLVARALLQAAKPVSLDEVACSRRGSFVLIEVARASLCYSEFRLRLSGSLDRMSKSKFGRKVMASFELTPPTCTAEASCGSVQFAAMAA